MKNNRKWKTTAFILTCGLTVALEGGAVAQTSAGSGLNAGIFATMDSYYNTDIVVSATNTVTTMDSLRMRQQPIQRYLQIQQQPIQRYLQIQQSVDIPILVLHRLTAV